MGRLNDQVAVVTGASGSLGGRAAAALAREGAAVILHYSSDEGAAARIAQEIIATGGRAHTVGADLAQPAESAGLITAATDTYGRLDILVTTAGIPADQPILAMNDREWRAVVESSLSAVFFCIRAALREFVRQRRGRIINIAAAAEQAGSAGQANYVAANAGLIGLTRAVAREVGSRGITVNMVVPGFLTSPDVDSAFAAGAAPLLTQIPLGRAGTPDEIAAAVLFLASEEAGYITGQVLHVDGGMVMH